MDKRLLKSLAIILFVVGILSSLYIFITNIEPAFEINKNLEESKAVLTAAQYSKMSGVAYNQILSLLLIQPFAFLLFSCLAAGIFILLYYLLGKHKCKY
ncbi:MAG: hypothetical protein FWD32_00295 [Firmicutes bacterium]|nr:hypothetical protein [Bacillota bacterium]